MPYFDHAATSFPKAPGVAAEGARFLEEDAGNAGRGSHRRAARAADAVEGCRRALASLLGVGDARRVALLPGATAALNAGLQGVLRPGARVLVGPEAHNAVLRPLRLLQERFPLDVSEVRSDDLLRWDLADLEERLRGGLDLVAVSHASNVTGAVQDLAAIGRLCRAHGALLLVDAAQTVGALPLDLGQLELDLLACAGHKGLLGPTGVGLLYVRPGLELTPFWSGGTGHRSEREEPPRELPEGLEVGTQNAWACAALRVAVDWVRRETPAALHARARRVGDVLCAGLEAAGLPLHAAREPGDLPVISFLVPGWDPQDLALVLDAAGEVAVRAGLHCAPRAHRRLGTLPAGTVRASVGPFLEEADAQTFLAVLAGVADLGKPA